VTDHGHDRSAEQRLEALEHAAYLEADFGAYDDEAWLDVPAGVDGDREVGWDEEGEAR
jgi:hypothetical protein